MEPGSGKSALLVEDDAATRALIARQLRRSGLDVLAVESGERLLAEAADRYASFDVVILDVHLPGMSGLDLASLIQARQPSMPIVLITGDADPRLAREALARGPVSFLLKPFEMFELQAAVNQALVGGNVTGDAADAEPEDDAETEQPWLDLVESSYMGSMHVRRVGRLALALAESLTEVEKRVDVGELLATAWAHELGRQGSATDPVAIAIEGSRMLSIRGCDSALVSAVRHLPERHDGTGGPDGLRGDAIPLISQMVAVADALEHYVATGLASETSAPEAVDRALGLVAVQRGTLFRPEIVDAALRQRSRLVAICGDSDRSDATVAA